jgi:predicted ester cyclase
VTQVFGRFPGLGLVVHELVTNGERLAMRFSEHGASPVDQGRYAAWGGIGLYKWNGRQLLENYVEQDFLAQEAQLSGSAPAAPLESPHLDPWVGTHAEPASAAAEAVVRDWLARADLRAAPEVIVDGSWYESLASSPIQADKVVVNDLFSAGSRVAFHVTQTGSYRGGLPGVDASRVGQHARLDCVGLAHVKDGRVASVRAISDRLGTAQNLRASS